MKNIKLSYILLFVLTAFLLQSCADVTIIEECVKVPPYGFWGGLWHGIVAVFAFFGSLFSDDIAVYAVNNTGGWYDFGFVLGTGILGASIGKSS